MTTEPTDTTVPLAPGSTAYDFLNDGYVVVLDYPTRMVADCKEALQELIFDSYPNQLVGVTESTPVVDIAYLSVNSKTTRPYTIPTTRLVVPDVSGAISKERTQRQLVIDTFARELFTAMEFRSADVESPVAPETLATRLHAAGVSEETAEQLRYEYADE